MEIRPPYGYREVVPLTRQHRVKARDGGAVPAAFRGVNAVPLSYAEFVAACRDYPIAFISADSGASYVAMAVLGLERRQNLFVTGDGAWEKGSYVPAYVRRYPYCMTRVSVNGQEQAERIACVEKDALDAKGEPLYDGQGQALPGWSERLKLLVEYEADLARSDELARALAARGLLEAFTMQAVPTEGGPLELSGMHRVVEQKLNELPADALKEFAQKGMLARIYAHLISLNNFGRLLDRRAVAPKRAAAGRKKPG